MGGVNLMLSAKQTCWGTLIALRDFLTCQITQTSFAPVIIFGLFLCAYVFFFPKLYSSVDLQHVCMHILQCTDAGCSSYQSQNPFQYLLTSPKSSDLWGLVPGRCALTNLHGKAIRRNPDQMPVSACSSYFSPDAPHTNTIRIPLWSKFILALKSKRLSILTQTSRLAVRVWLQIDLRLSIYHSDLIQQLHYSILISSSHMPPYHHFWEISHHT